VPGADAYDRLPYTDHAYAESHPDRLSVVARLARWAPPEIATARVLELGCGRGGNMLPMAAGLPGGSFVGVDRSGRQVGTARNIARSTGLTNVAFVEGDFATDAPAPGSWDFVVAHGVCSWVSPESRCALLRSVARAMSPGALAYVSLNVLPGWYERMAARDWLRAHRTEGPQEALAWLREHVSPELGDVRRRLDAVLRRLAETDAAYTAHEYLSDEHHPQLVRDHLREAREAGLTYVGDAIPGETALEMLPGAVRERAATLDVDAAQELVDFVRNSAFRRSVFVRTDEANRRGWRWSGELSVGGLDGVRVASRLRPHGPPVDDAPSERFDGLDVSVSIADPGARRALRILAELAPLALPLDELTRRSVAEGPGLRTEIFDLWLATGAVDLHAHAPALASATSLRPRACPVARWHAANGGPLTNRWHQEVRIDDPVLRALLANMTGDHDIAAIAHAVGTSERIAGAAVSAAAAAALLEE
jgi:SAM-dependent methyltransferase